MLTTSEYIFFPPSQGPAKTIAARDRKKLRRWTQVVQTKVHFFSFLEVNIQLRIAQDNICFFQVLRQLYSALVPLSALYNCLHSRCFTYKVNALHTKSIELILFLHFHVRSLDMLMSIEIDKSQYKSIASPEKSVIIDFYRQIQLINRHLSSTIDWTYRLPFRWSIPIDMLRPGFVKTQCQVVQINQSEIRNSYSVKLKNSNHYCMFSELPFVGQLLSYCLHIIIWRQQLRNLGLEKISSNSTIPSHTPPPPLPSHTEVSRNRPFYSGLLGDLASEWQRGWRWPCFDTDLAAFLV